MTKFDAYGEPVGYPRKHTTSDDSKNIPVSQRDTGYFEQKATENDETSLASSSKKTEANPRPVSEHVAVASKVIQEEFTQERRHILGNRFKRIMLELQDEPNYRDAVETLFKYAGYVEFSNRHF